MTWILIALGLAAVLVLAFGWLARQLVDDVVRALGGRRGDRRAGARMRRLLGLH